jgi:N-glycosylase/DNA lyase
MKLENIPFNLDVTLCCGQVFRWHKKNDYWYGIVGEKVFRICQNDGELDFKNVDEKYVKHYFGLNDNLQEIRQKTGKDEYAKQALRKFWGLRIIRQDPWECIISYICATYKNIAAISHMLLSLSKKFGEKIEFDGCEFYTFPTPKKLANTTENELRKCSLGYRAKYVLGTSKRIYEEEIKLENLRRLPYEQAKNQLLTFKGIGPKVADCILLFSMEKLNAFPVDVWVKRIMLRHYAQHFSSDFIRKMSKQNSPTNLEYQEMNAFGRNYFGEYAGYAQEYLFHYERTLQ